MRKVHVSIKLEGKVQGVTFRETTKYVADHAGIKGFVRNEPDGSLYLEAEAEQWELDSFIDWCNEGPDRAQVDTCEVREGELKNFTDFVIIKK
jgi:acylphosphatase